MLTRKKIKTAFIISTLACLPFTGFIYGFVVCSDCGVGFKSILGRIFLGLIYAFFTVISFGKPWTGGGIISSVNLRLYVLLAFILIFLVVYFIMLLKQNKKQII